MSGLEITPDIYDTSIKFIINLIITDNPGLVKRGYKILCKIIDKLSVTTFQNVIEIYKQVQPYKTQFGCGGRIKVINALLTKLQQIPISGSETQAMLFEFVFDVIFQYIPFINETSKKRREQCMNGLLSVYNIMKNQNSLETLFQFVS